MKKYFIIAVAALAASAACSKVETINQTPDTLIGFNVVKYAGQTKADAYNSLLDEKVNDTTITHFRTNAWFHAEGYAAQAFMVDQIVLSDNDSNTASAPTYWAPFGRNYYWPKTGYINFFSYAGLPAPTAKAEGSLTYNNVTVGTGSNILVADAAYRYSQNATSATPYGQNGVTEGVPTLFRHILAKVKFDVIFDAKTGMTASDKDKWTVSITSASINVPQQGSITLNFTDPASTGTAAHAGSDAWGSLASYTAVNNVTGTGANVASPENYEIDDAITLTAVAGKKSDEENRTDGTDTGAPAELIAESAVIPHTLGDNVTFSMSYKLAYSYDGGTPIQENVTVSNVKLTEFAPSISAWAMNTIYTYHVIIRPNKVVLFDPAVETWAPETDEPVYTVE